MKERLNKYFKRSEFSCKCGCGFNTVDIELLKILTEIREYFGKPVIIKSGCRCEKHNKKVNGSLKSKHMRAQATDVEVKGITSAVIYAYLKLKYPKIYGLGLHKRFIHFDVRKRKWRKIYRW